LTGRTDLCPRRRARPSVEHYRPIAQRSDSKTRLFDPADLFSTGGVERHEEEPTQIVQHGYVRMGVLDQPALLYVQI
jgi:hypothetical protein